MIWTARLAVMFLNEIAVPSVIWKTCAISSGDIMMPYHPGTVMVGSYQNGIKWSLSDMEIHIKMESFFFFLLLLLLLLLQYDVAQSRAARRGAGRFGCGVRDPALQSIAVSLLATLRNLKNKCWPKTFLFFELV